MPPHSKLQYSSVKRAPKSEIKNVADTNRLDEQVVWEAKATHEEGWNKKRFKKRNTEERGSTSCFSKTSCTAGFNSISRFYIQAGDQKSDFI